EGDFERAKAFSEQNKQIMLQNEVINHAIIEKAREKTNEYNDQACRATIAATVMDAIQNNSTINLNAVQQQLLISECKKNYPNYNTMKPEQQLAIQKEIGANLAPIPANGQVHEYIPVIFQNAIFSRLLFTSMKLKKTRHRMFYDSFFKIP
ncbi:MAG: hypothetical protein K2X39_02640, partial [Silvanigrellaceae bacterium]|nr:hypothetical protein [Silvanigrellaceae bacterium]